MHEFIEHKAPKVLVDEYGNFHQITDELARGGQGVVYRTKDADLAVKQPLDASGQPDKNANLRERFQRIRLLPMPRHILMLPLFCGVLSSRLTRLFCAVPRTSVSRIA